jgi:hypothetical protein
MPTPNRPASQNKYPEQYMGNTSFDEDFGVNTVEILSYNPVSDSLERVSEIQGNGSLALTYDASGNPITLTKTVGSTNYSKTLTWDTDGNLTNISVWT